MMRLFPDSIAGRSMLALLVGLTASHLLSTAVSSTDRQNAILEVNERLFADRLTSAVRLVELASEERRPALVKALDGQFFSITYTRDATVPSLSGGAEEAHAVAMFLASRFSETGRQHVIVRVADASSMSDLPSFALSRPAIQASVQLDDGSWVNGGMEQIAKTGWSLHNVLSALIMITGIAVFAALAIRWIGRPLTTFAKAAGRLGRDVNAPPLPLVGPMEVRTSAAAFNEMQTRIRRFVEERTQMLAAISHDLRSPITRLRLRTEMLPEGEVRTRTLADLDEMLAMVVSTLAFAKGDMHSEPVQTIDLAATIESICDNATDMGLAAEYIWTRRLVCHCRPLALKRALVNLIENAARYGSKAVVSASQSGSDLCVVIEDEGPGIPEDSMEKVFTPFYRIEQSRSRTTGGMGLGMTVSRDIIRSHGGDITLHNKPEGGLRIVVTLPQDTKQHIGDAE